MNKPRLFLALSSLLVLSGHEAKPIHTKDPDPSGEVQGLLGTGNDDIRRLLGEHGWIDEGDTGSGS